MSIKDSRKSQGDVQFYSIKAPTNLMNIYSLQNHSSYLTYVVYHLSKSRFMPTWLLITHIAWHGWTGMICEFGGIQFYSLVEKLEMGPFCNRYHSIDKQLIEQRAVYLRGGKMVVYAFHPFFNLSLRWNFTVSLGHSYSLPLIPQISRFTINTAIGTMQAELGAGNAGNYHIWWNQIDNLHISFLPACMPIKMTGTVKVGLGYVQAGLTKFFVHRMMNLEHQKSCQKGLSVLHNVFHTGLGVEYTVKTPCCWIAPMWEILVTPRKSSYKNIPHTTIISIKYFDAITVSMSTISVMEIYFFPYFYRLSYLHIKFSISSREWVEIKRSKNHLCVVCHSLSQQGTRAKEKNYEWKYFSLETRMYVYTENFLLGVWIKMWISIMNYTSSAQYWQDVPSNRVFLPEYDWRRYTEYHQQNVSIALPHQLLLLYGRLWSFIKLVFRHLHIRYISHVGVVTGPI